MTVSFVCAIGPSICMETEANPDNPACVCEQEQKERVPSLLFSLSGPPLSSRAQAGLSGGAPTLSRRCTDRLPRCRFAFLFRLRRPFSRSRRRGVTIQAWLSPYGVSGVNQSPAINGSSTSANRRGRHSAAQAHTAGDAARHDALGIVTLRRWPCEDVAGHRLGYLQRLVGRTG